MASLAYYNENDPKAAAWLRELIRHGHIAAGVVDDRSIEDVVPAEIAHFAQCHFFAGVGAWSLALRQGGWPDDRPAWTASLPCQPFSAAGARGGFADERHLWPVFLHLLTHGKHRTVPVLGEQVANRGGLEWFDLVSIDLEGAGYAIGAADTCAAGFGAPHLRQRLYWLADATDGGREPRPGFAALPARKVRCDAIPQSRAGRRDDGMADAQHAQRGAFGVDRGHGRDGTDDGRTKAHGVTGTRGEVHGVADAGRVGRQRRRAGEESGRDALPAAERRGDAGGLADAQRTGVRDERSDDGSETGTLPREIRQQRLRSDTRPAGAVGVLADAGERGGIGRNAPIARGDGENDRLPGGNGDAGGLADAGHRPGPVNGHWADADWLLCRDNKWRPVEPGTFPLVTGAAARVGRLRGYGNSLCVPQAEAFVRAAIDALW